MVDEEHYTPYKVDSLLKDYPPIHNQLAPAIEQWLKDRTVTDINIEDLSIKQVMSNQQVHFLVAIKRLNELLDENIPSDQRRKLLKILNQPVYFE